MRILLLNSPLTLGPQFPIPSIIRDKGKDVPLGLLYLAASLRSAGFDEVEVLDVHTLGLDPATTAAEVARRRPDLVGITVYSFSCADVQELLRRVRAALPDAHVALGGPHAELYPDLLVGPGWGDSVCVGYGERVLVDLARALDEGREPTGIPGLGLAGPDAPPRLPAAGLPESIDAIPFPDRSLIDPAVYVSWVVEREVPTTAMLTSRGCPLGCVFCAQARKPFAQRSVANVMDEVRECRDRGFRMIHFEDDVMNLVPAWMMELGGAMEALPDAPRWGLRARVTGFDDEVARACARGGCVRINFGVESGDENIIRTVGKATNLSQVRRAVAAARGAGLSTVCYFVLGFPGETRAEMRRTYHFARELDPDYAQFTPLVLLPRTALYRREQEIHGAGFDPFADYTRDPGPAFTPPPPTGALPRQQVFAMVRWAFLRYYFTPRYLLSGRGTRGGFLRGLRAGWSLLVYVLAGPREWARPRDPVPAAAR